MAKSWIFALVDFGCATTAVPKNENSFSSIVTMSFQRVRENFGIVLHTLLYYNRNYVYQYDVL